MYKLIIEDDEGKTTVVPLIRDEITIGRKEGNTIRLTERNVSRKHAKLLKSNGSVFIEDLTSYNGIKINGDRIAGRAPINEGDRIQIGDYQLALKLDKQQQAGAATGAPQGPVHDEKTTPFMKDGNGAAPSSMMEAAPTVQTPLLHPPVSGQQDTPARLVVVSSNFAGQEFLLDKAAVVIGRTDENDVVINHRSISRHHAKIVRENGHYHIVDLQSANGVRVNGEEYGKVELRKGDHIDLGHVRLRFVAPGEDFLFDRDAQVVDVGGGRGMKSRVGLVVALLVVVLALVGGAIALVKLGGKGGDKSGDTGQHSGDTEGQVAKLLLDADKAMKTGDWDSAVTKCDEALKLDSSQEMARDKRQKAEAEKKNHAAYLNFISFADKNDLDAAVASWNEVAEDSVYRQKGAERFAQVKKAYMRSQLDLARKAKAANKCEEARQHVEAVLMVDESNAEGQEIIKSCGIVRTPPQPPVIKQPKEPKEPKVAVQPKVKEPREPKEPKEPKATVEPNESDTPPANANNPIADKIYQEAQDAYVHGQYANAIELANKLKKLQPAKAWRIIGASNCFLKDRTGAMSAWGKLDPTGRQFLKYVCSRNAITIP